MKKLPILYHKAKGGDLRQWSVWTEGPHIITEYGQINGKLQQSSKTAVGKNIGRSNETTPEEQAVLEAESLWQHKVDRKYSETLEAAQEPLLLPMLAHKFTEKKFDFSCGADLQPKMDGNRLLSTRNQDGSILLLSRGGKEWNIPHIAAELDKWLDVDTVLDGEIYIHGESCQRITSLAKSADPAGKSYKLESKALEYHVYDVPLISGDDCLLWSARRIFLQDLNSRPGIKVVETISVTNEQEVAEAHDLYVSQGYEGAILRGREGRYLWGYRSSDLLKIKSFEDAEFRVIDAKEGIGRMKGCAIFICQNDIKDNTFDCTLKVPMSERARLFNERSKYINQLLTVKFFGRTDDKLPRFPVGIHFRDLIDLP